MGDILTEFDQEAYDRHRRVEGYNEGARDAKLEAAKNLLADGKYSAEQISMLLQIPITEFTKQ